MTCARTLRVVVYHYVRDLPRTPFPRIKGLCTDDFRRQISRLQDEDEMVGLEAAIDFLAGRYQPKRNLCLLTFDDGLMDHYTDVLPVLSDAGIQGVFFVSTACLAAHVAAVHKSHFLMAALGFEAYRRVFIEQLAAESPDTATDVPLEPALHLYRMDEPDVARFKYLLNVRLDHSVRRCILDALFARYIGDEATFARELYMGWRELREMQAEGMAIGGHSHAHHVLSGMTSDCQREDISLCASVLTSGLRPQPVWPFSYPYGEFNAATIAIVQDLGYACAFTVEAGMNAVSQDLFRIKRLDTKDLAF